MNDHDEIQSQLAKYLADAETFGTLHLHRIGPVPMLVSPVGVQVLDHRNQPMTHRPVSLELASILVETW